MIRLRVWVAIGLTAIGLYLVGRWQGAASVADAAAVQRAEDATSATVRKAYHGTQAKLLAVEQQGQRAMQIGKRLADSLRARALRVDTVTVVAASDSSAVGLWRATANAEHETARICAGTLQTCQERAQAAMSRAASLDSLLGNVLKVKDCHILFIRCPSRTATGLLGLGLGFAGGLLVTR